MGIKFDAMLTSASKRAILTLKYLRETYVHSETTPCEVMTQIHEEGGMFINGQGFPGLTRPQVMELLPEM